jgi:hypothetical protein
VDNINVDSKSFWNNDGIDIVDCDSVSVTNSFFDAADDGICLKSHSKEYICQNVYIHNNVIRTSANGVKFGTASLGGFRNITIINNIVYDTYRSALAFFSVDGGVVENIKVDSLRAINTGNLFFIKLGDRGQPGKKGRIKNISISNVYAEIASSTPDAGYSYEGPVEHMPRNISPSSIIGMPDNDIENIQLKNIELKHPGGGNELFAKRGLNELDDIPELSGSYPEFSMFGELPAWGFYFRHIKDITLENVTISCRKDDYRVPVVLDDVHNADLEQLKVSGNKQNEDVYIHKSDKIKTRLNNENP